MEEATDIACIICCSGNCEDFQGLTFNLSGEEDEEDIRNEVHANNKWIFKQFCSQLLSIQSLEVERSLSVCSACLDDLTWVVDTKRRVDAVEGRVRKLQQSILMELRELQGCMSTLEEQLDKIKDSVRISNGEAIFEHRRMLKTKRGQMRICEDGNGAVFFRKSISDVARNLRRFCGGLSSRFPVGGYGVSTKRSASILATDKVIKVEATENFDNLPSQPDYYDDEYNNLEVVDSNAHLFLSDSNGDNDNSSISPDFEHLSDVDLSVNKKQRFPKDRSKTLAPPPSRSREKKRNHKPTSKEFLSTTDDECSSKDVKSQIPLKSASLNSIKKNSSKCRGPKSATKDLLLTKPASKLDPAPSTSSSDSEVDDKTLKNKDKINSFKTEPRRLTRQSSKARLSSSRRPTKKMNLSNDVVDNDQSHSDDSEMEDGLYEGEPSTRLQSSGNILKEPKIKISKNPAIKLIDFSGMSEFKKYVILNLLNKQLNHFVEDPDGGESSCNQNSADYHLRQAEQERISTLIEYDPYSDKLLVKGFELFINESENTVECVECPYKISVQWPANTKKERSHFVQSGKRRLKAHIISNHRPDFNCPLCPPEITTGYKLEPYIVHLKTHMKTHPFTCSVCQRPLTSEVSLKTHLRTHMNEEEKMEAALTDGIDPSCPVKPKRSNKTVLQICPMCGKAIRKFYFNKHVEKVCGVPVGAPRIKCHLCDKTFKHKDLVQRHIQRTHSQDAKNRPFRCHECPSSFKVKWDLTHHMKIHAEERIYKCHKGCGRDFATKKNWKRHQDTCKGVLRIKREVD